MKKLFAILLSVMMLVSVFAFSAMAEGETFVKEPDFKAEDYGTLVYDGPSDLDVVAGYVGTIDTDLYNLKSGGEQFCPKGDTCVWWSFNVEKAGTYTFAFKFVARGQNPRAVNYVIDAKDFTDESEQTEVYLDHCAEDNTDKRFCIITADLEAGEHTFCIHSATHFDDATTWSADVYGLKVMLTAEKPADPEPTTADATGDTTAAVIALMAASLAAAYVFSRKH